MFVFRCGVFEVVGPKVFGSLGQAYGNVRLCLDYRAKLARCISDLG
jgi:hypothetical protein